MLSRAYPRGLIFLLLIILNNKVVGTTVRLSWYIGLVGYVYIPIITVIQSAEFPFRNLKFIDETISLYANSVIAYFEQVLEE